MSYKRAHIGYREIGNVAVSRRGPLCRIEVDNLGPGHKELPFGMKVTLRNLVTGRRYVGTGENLDEAAWKIWQQLPAAMKLHGHQGLAW